MMPVWVAGLAGLVFGIAFAVVGALGGNARMGIGAGQVLLVLGGALLGLFLFQSGTRRHVPWLGAGLLGLATGMAWTSGLWNWFQYEPLTHPGSNPLYGRRSLFAELVRGLLTPLWGSLIAASMVLAWTPPIARSSRFAWAGLAVYYGMLAWPIPDFYRTWRDYPQSYEVPFGLIAFGILFACSIPLLVRTIREGRTRTFAAAPSVSEPDVGMVR